ncbi:pilus assembly protein PilM [Roseiconus lacunae]|uniref:pilus assembly protein PilM n=1 Tax=Roseiconus lacunae TaxID=2605694 RepID=UPI0011F1CB22|nr:pilus assembly protein PilM [Roseiconus lacunae]
MSLSPQDTLAGTNDSLPSGMVACGKCQTPNDANSQYCAGCGHTLYEKCKGCDKPVLLTQAFCGSCGQDLRAAIRRESQQFEDKLARAVEATKAADYDTARSLLSSVIAKKSDFRFTELVHNAEVALAKIERIASQLTSNAAESIVAAGNAFEQEDYKRVIALLSPIPERLLTDEARQFLEKSQLTIRQFDVSTSQLRKAIEARDYVVAGQHLDLLLDQQPDNQKYQRLAQQVGDKLRQKAERRLQQNRYRSAIDYLQSVPASARNDAYSKLVEQAEKLQWMSQQFSGEPFATPVLGRLAKRWNELAPEDTKAKEALATIAKRIKAERGDPRSLFAPRRLKTRSWIGGDLNVLAYPTVIKGCDHNEMQRAAAEFNVAIGLALQGLGEAPITDQFYQPKQGLLGRLRRKKTNRCWGFDLGGSAVHAICLQRSEEDGTIEVVDCFSKRFENVGAQLKSSDLQQAWIKESVEQFTEGRDLSEVPVWVSLRGRELVTRFVQLPPVSDKQAKLLFEREIEDRIPVELDEVEMVKWLCELPDEEQHTLGRPSFVAAAKKSHLEPFVASLESAGLPISGIQAAPIALLNFAATEFKELLNETTQGDDSPEANGRPSQHSIPAIAIVDGGAETTTVCFVSSRAYWFWTIESGGAEFTRLIARSSQKTHAEAEQLKRDVAQIDQPHLVMEPVERRLDELRSRLDKIVTDATKTTAPFHIMQTWCCGGGCKMHGWIKTILSEQAS